MLISKSQLLSDISEVKSQVNIPHNPDRRESEHRAARVMDDIIAVFTCLDEHLRLTALPKYVAEGPGVMPSSRLY